MAALSALVLAAVLLCACAHSDQSQSISMSRSVYSANVVRSFDPASLLSGCLYEGRWYASGVRVPMRVPCLRCVCSRSALSCSRRECAPLPELPPKTCHIKQSRENCCPVMECPDGVINTEREEIYSSDIAIPSSLGQACVEGGTVYAGGSAMSSSIACEQCFCLKGLKKCVTPTCMTAPPHCVPRPSAGACCPQRYYCEHYTVKDQNFDCRVYGQVVKEGDRIMTKANCTSCFCLKGKVKCQETGCAPRILGCKPIIRPGECCAHQYKCEPKKKKGSSNRKTTPETTTSKAIFKFKFEQPERTTIKPMSADNKHSITSQPVPTRSDDRALHAPETERLDHENAEYPLISADSAEGDQTDYIIPPDTDDILVNKVKRKTEEFPLNSTKIGHNDTTATTSQKPFTVAKLVTEETSELSTDRTTGQPDGTVKIVINGTINCTAELSSTSLPLSITLNDTEKIQMEAMPRVPIVNGIEAQTYSPNDIITDRSVNGDFDENDTFTINVTSSLNTNTNSTSRPVMTAASKKPVPVDLADSVNTSKKTKGDYDYDYTEPTLPPSLPNLKIIPFVAADAVVDDETSKEPLTYPILEREDKFPIYYPTSTKDTSLTRREDTYHPTQYPVFISEKKPNYDIDSNRYPIVNDLVHEYTVSTSLGGHVNEGKAVTKAPITSSTFKLATPAVNLFQPPIETEGGFVPKGPGFIDEYYAAYPSTPSGPPVPHLTTSMQLDISKGQCTSDDGTHITNGETITIECRSCICSWGRLSCVPVLCRAPSGCEFKAATNYSVDQCCGDIVCHTENTTTTTASAPVAEKAKVNKSEIEIAANNPSIVSEPSKILQQTHPANTTVSIENKDNYNENRNKITIIPTRTTPSILTTKKPNTNIKLAPVTSADTSATTPKALTKLTTTDLPTTDVPTTDVPTTKQVNYTEYEDDEDEGFSFGSVLKLLLSDSYDSTTTKKPKTTKPPTKPSQPVTTMNPFIPLPALSYFPEKISPSTVNRIDHLVLGEATAIKRTTPRPITNKTTKRTTELVTEKTDVDLAFTSGPRPPNLSNLPGPGLPGIGAGILKLAGCNIYGRMYRVGRIITELSTPCQECWCSELGVQCKPLAC